MKTQLLAMMLATAIMLPAMLCFAESLQQDPQSAPAPQRMLRVAQGVMKNNLLKHPEPVYPREAKANGIQGQVLLLVHTDRDGNTEIVKVESGDPVLAQAAIDAVRRWKYKPMLLNGEPVMVETTIRIQFHLEDWSANRRQIP